MNRLFSNLTIVLLLLNTCDFRILLNDGSIRLKNHSTSPKLKSYLNKDFQDMFERRLAELASRNSLPSQSFKIDKDDDYKKLKFMEIVSSIRKTAKERNLSIKSIKLGTNIRKVFENENIAKILNQYINDPKFDQKLAKERKKFIAFKQQRALLSKTKRNKRKLQGMRPAAGAQNMNFVMSGDLTQMPFPPMVMNGPHFHPPMNITINQLPNMNPRSEKNPLELQLSEYENQAKGLEKLLSTIDSATGPVAMFGDLKRQVDKKLGESFDFVKDKALD